jgi:hypothetical protein
MLVDKMLDKSEPVSVYAIYLQAMKNNKMLKDLFPVLVKESLEAAYGNIKEAKLGDFGYFATDFMMFLINIIILGCEILDVRDTFLENRNFFVDVVKLYFDYCDKKKTV